MKLILGLGIFLLGACSLHAYKSYAGYQILRTQPLNEITVPFISTQFNNAEGVELLMAPELDKHVDIAVSGHLFQYVSRKLSSINIEFEVLVSDVGRMIREEREKIESIRSKETPGSKTLTFERYMEFHEILAYLDDVVLRFPQLTTMINFGKSYLDNPMRGLKLSSGPGKPGIFLDAGIHGCEWAGPPNLLYAIDQLTRPENLALLDTIDFYILPIANPDAYLYSWTDQRFWRKTRQPNEGSECIGTDANRNWDFQWKSDPDICGVSYSGSGPFSTPEVRNLGVFLTFNTAISNVVSMHSFGRQILYPWGYTQNLTENSDELDMIGKEAADAMYEISGLNYTVGSIGNTLYVANGGTTDWAYGGASIQITYTIELPAGGSLGFDLPPEEILPMVLETWPAIKVFAKHTPPVRG